MNTFDKVKIVTTWRPRFDVLVATAESAGLPTYTQSAFCALGRPWLKEPVFSRYLSLQYLPDSKTVVEVERIFKAEEARLGVVYKP